MTDPKLVDWKGKRLDKNWDYKSGHQRAILTENLKVGY